MKKIFLPGFFVLILPALFLLAPGCEKQEKPPGEAPGMSSEAPGQEGSQVWIRVEGTNITRGQVQEQVSMIEQQLKSQYQVSADQLPRDSIERQAMQSLVQKTVLDQAMEEADISVEAAEITEELANFKDQFPDEQTYQQQLQQNNTTEEQLKDQIRQMLRYEELIEKKLEIEEPTEDEIAMVYERSKERLKEPAEAKAQHLLLMLSPNAPEMDKQKKRELAEKLSKRAKAGEDFAELVGEYSESPNKEKGGLQTFTKGQMTEEFDQALFSLEAGQVSDAIETPMGFYVLKVVDIKPERAASLEDVKEDIMSFLNQQKKAEALEGYVQGLVENANVDYLEPLPEPEAQQPPGASPPPQPPPSPPPQTGE